jgi:capsular polysaccharide transport system permease protein
MGLEPDRLAFRTIHDLRAERDRLASATDWGACARVAREVLGHPDVEPIDFRVASSVAVQDGGIAEALRHGAVACERAPHHAEFALHMGCLLNQSGQNADAIAYLIRSARIDATVPDTYQQLAHAAQALGNLDSAMKLAWQAYQLDQGNLQRGMIAAHLLSRLERWDDAARLARLAMERAGPAAFAYRSLAGYLEHVRDFAAALDCMDKALAMEPDNAEFHAYRAFMLIELSRPEEADAALMRAARLDPVNLPGQRHAISLLVDKGKLHQALRYGGHLLSAQPDHPEYAECMRFLLEAKAMNLAAFDYNEIAALKSVGPPRRLADPPTFSEVLNRQSRTILALALRDIRSRHGESRISMFWMLMEPFLHIGVLAVVFQFTMHGSPPLGTSFFLFYFTGVMPYLLLSHLIMNLGSAVKSQRYLMQIPFVTPMEILIAKGLVEAFSTSIIFVIFICLFFVFGVDATPANMLSIFYAFLMTFMLGFGLGTICASLVEFGAGTEAVVAVLLRFVYFTSGIFYVPATIPVSARDILVWNPFLHIIDSMRIGFFKFYDPPWLDLRYPAFFAVLSLVAGLSSVTLMRRRMRTY